MTTLEDELEKWITKHNGWEEKFLTGNHGPKVFFLPYEKETDEWSFAVAKEDGASVIAQNGYSGDYEQFGSIRALDEWNSTRSRG